MAEPTNHGDVYKMGSFVGAAGMLWSDSTEITDSGEGDYRKLRYVQERNTRV